MMNQYNKNDVVSFVYSRDDKEYVYTGYVYIVDRFGTFEQCEEPSYDVMVELDEDNPLGFDQGLCLFKHIPESKIMKGMS